MNKLVMVLVIAVLTLAVGEVYLWKGLGEARQQNAELQANIKQMEGAGQSLLSAFTRQTRPAAADAPTTDTPATPGAARQPAAGRAAAAALISGIRETMSSPEGQEMARAQARRFLPQRYPGLGKALNLTPDQENKLFDLLARQQADQSANTLALLTGGGARDPGAIQEMQRQRQELQQANSSEVAAMLGSKYPQYQEYQESLPQRQQVTQLQTLLSSSGNALSDAQADSLTTALAAEQRRISQESGSATGLTVEQRLQRNADNNQRLVNAASAHLNSQQLDSYQKMLDQQQNMGNALLRGLGGLAGARGQAGGTAPTSP